MRLDISYDGTDFAGWAVQRGRRTVAGDIGSALSTLFRGPVPLVVAGRTDAGVHATGQVAHIDVATTGLAALAPRSLTESTTEELTAARPPFLVSSRERDLTGATPDLDAGRVGLLRRLSGLLQRDVRVRAVTVAPEGFDARFSALRRHYRYRIATAEWGAEPLRRKDSYALRRRLQVELMQAAADPLIGLHDFAAYCRPRDNATTIRDLQRLLVTADGDEVRVDVAADAFCHSMVRSLVGALVAVGEGKADVAAPARLLAARERTAAIRIAPAHGLTLVGVEYPPDAELSARTEVTRALRS